LYIICLKSRAVAIVVVWDVAIGVVWDVAIGVVWDVAIGVVWATSCRQSNGFISKLFL
jgi:hypothetical protein